VPLPGQTPCLPLSPDCPLEVVPEEPLGELAAEDEPALEPQVGGLDAAPVDDLSSLDASVDDLSSLDAPELLDDEDTVDGASLETVGEPLGQPLLEESDSEPNLDGDIEQDQQDIESVPPFEQTEQRRAQKPADSTSRAAPSGNTSGNGNETDTDNNISTNKTTTTSINNNNNTSSSPDQVAQASTKRPRRFRVRLVRTTRIIRRVIRTTPLPSDSQSTIQVGSESPATLSANSTARSPAKLDTDSASVKDLASSGLQTNAAEPAGATTTEQPASIQAGSVPTVDSPSNNTVQSVGTEIGGIGGLEGEIMDREQPLSGNQSSDLNNSVPKQASASTVK